MSTPTNLDIHLSFARSTGAAVMKERAAWLFCALAFSCQWIYRQPAFVFIQFAKQSEDKRA
jgi:hypothetical protein